MVIPFLNVVAVTNIRNYHVKIAKKGFLILFKIYLIFIMERNNFFYYACKYWLDNNYIIY